MSKNVDIEAINPLHGNVNYLKDLRNISRKNRKNPTLAEEKMWREVLSNRKTGYKFLRQKPIGRYILDFYCSKLNLSVEIDGSSHKNKNGFDLSRDRFFKQVGISTIRFTNKEVFTDIEKVKLKLLSSISAGSDN